MNPSEEEVVKWLKLQLRHISHYRQLTAGETEKQGMATTTLALLDAARKDRELLAGVQRVEMDMREDGERVCWDGVAGTFCFSDGTCHAESIAAMGLDIMRRDP